jgi:hypothetical protein
VAKQEIKGLNFYTRSSQVLLPLKFYFRDWNPKIYSEGGQPAGIEGVRQGRPEPGSSFWVIQEKNELRSGVGAPWVDKGLQCSFDLRSHVATFVAAEVQQLKPLGKCDTIK